MKRTAAEKIQMAREAGVKEKAIAFHYKMKAGDKVSNEQLSSFYQEHGLPDLTKPLMSDMTRTIMSTTGDIVGTAAMGHIAPHLTGLRAIKAAPKIAKSAINIGSRMFGSAAGTTAGNIATDAIQGQKINLDAIKQDALIGGGSELAFGVAKPLLKLGGRAIRFGADVTGVGKTGRAMYRDFILKRTTDDAHKVLKDLGVSPEMGPAIRKKETGLKAGEVMRKKLDYKEVYKNYNQAVDDMGEEIILKNTTEMIDELVKKHGNINRAINVMGLKPNKGAGKIIKAQFNEARDFGDAAEVKQILARVWKEGKHGDLVPREINLRSKLKETILDDIGMQSGIAWIEKKAGDEIFKNSNNFLRENFVAKQWFQQLKFYQGMRMFQKKPGAFVDELFETRNFPELKGLKNQIINEPGGKEAWAGLEHHWLYNMFQASTSRDKNTMERIIHPALLIEQIQKNKKFIQKLMPETWPKMRKLMPELYKMAPYTKGDWKAVIQSYKLLPDKSQKHLKSFLKASDMATWAGGKAASHALYGAKETSEMERMINAMQQEVEGSEQ